MMRQLGLPRQAQAPESKAPASVLRGSAQSGKKKPHTLLAPGQNGFARSGKPRKVALCADLDTARHPEMLGLEGEHFDAQPWLILFTGADEAREALRNDRVIGEVWVVSCDDVAPINLAAALKADVPTRPVFLVASPESGSLCSRARAAGIEATLSPRELAARYALYKRKAREFGGAGEGAWDTVANKMPAVKEASAQTAPLSRLEGPAERIGAPTWTNGDALGGFAAQTDSAPSQEPTPFPAGEPETVWNSVARETTVSETPWNCACAGAPLPAETLEYPWNAAALEARMSGESSAPPIASRSPEAFASPYDVPPAEASRSAWESRPAEASVSQPAFACAGMPATGCVLHPASEPLPKPAGGMPVPAPASEPLLTPVPATQAAAFAPQPAPVPVPIPASDSASAGSQPVVFGTAGALASDARTSRGERSAFLLSVVSGSGGSGKSTVSALAACLSQAMGLKTLLLDFDLQFGDAGALVGAQSPLTVDALLESPARAETLACTGQSPAVLGAPPRIEQADELIERTGAVLDLVAPRFEVVIANTGAAWADHHAVLLERSSKALFLMDQRPGSLRACRHALDLCARLGIATGPFLFALNRCSKGAPFTPLDVSCAFGGTTVSELRDGGFAVEAALSAGRPLDLVEARNELAVSLEALLSPLLPGAESRTPVCQAPERARTPLFAAMRAMRRRRAEA